MSDWGYVWLAWAITAAVLVAYAGWVIARGRVASRKVPPGERRWM